MDPRACAPPSRSTTSPDAPARPAAAAPLTAGFVRRPGALGCGRQVYTADPSAIVPPSNNSKRGIPMKATAGVAAAAAVLVASVTVAHAAQAPTVRDLVRQVRLADPQLSPDGRTVAVVETRADLESDEFRSEIVLVEVASGAIRPLTRARHHAGAPRWSPTGDRIAFIAPDADKNGQLFVLPMSGGDALQLTKGKDGVSQFAWSPDGASIAYTVQDPKPELKGEDKYRTEFKVGNDDFTISEAVRPTHLWLVPAQGGEAKRLTSGDWSLPSSLPPGSAELSDRLVEGRQEHPD